MKEEVGEVLHVSKSGRLIIKSISKDVSDLRRGTILVDAKGRRVAKVIELIGPVDSPYISALPLTDRTKRYIGARLYASGIDESSKGQGNRKRVARGSRNRKKKDREGEGDDDVDDE